MNASEILVTGGTGSLGSRVVDRLRDAGVGVQVMTSSGRGGTVRGDLLTGEGLEKAGTHRASGSKYSRKPHPPDRIA